MFRVTELRLRISWLVILALVGMQVRLPAFVAFAQAGQAQVEQDLASLERLFDALQETAADIPRDTFDPQAILALTDSTPDGVFAWVRDHTYLVPYRGALRGPMGVLMDRVGNSLDRALLLQELLRLLGHDTRLARAQLTDAESRDVLSRRRPLPAAGARPGSTVVDPRGDLGRLAETFGLDAAQLERALEQTAQQHADVQAELEVRIAAQTALLESALGASGGDPSAASAEHLAALRDHWWVEYLVDGVWTGLDPTLPDAAPGRPSAMAAGYLIATTLEELPSELLHTIQIRVVLECAWEGQLQETTLVESPMMGVASLVGQRIAIGHIPTKLPRVTDPTDVAALKTQILEQDRWFPMISIGPTQVYTNDYSSSCHIGTATPPTFGTETAGIFEAAMGVFDEPSLDEPERVTAQWIEYGLQVPGAGDQTIRRQIFDVLGPAARASGVGFAPTEDQQAAWRLALLGETEILPLSSALSPEYAAWMTVQSLVTSRDALLEVVRDSPPASRLVEVASRLDRQPSQLHALALARTAWGGDGVYIDRANVLSYHRQHALDEAHGLVGFEGFDIVVNSVAVDPSLTSPRRSRLVQGIADTNAEAALLALACEITVGSSCSTTTNPSVLHAIMDAQGISWRTIRSESDLVDVDASPDVKSRVMDDLRGGYVVVIPESPVRVDEKDAIGWWRIDPASGETLGIGELGWGAETAEYVLATITLGIGTASCFAGASQATGAWVNCVAGALVGGLAIMFLAVPVIAACIGVMSAFFLAVPSFTN